MRQADNWITRDASQAISFNDDVDTFGWPDGTSIHYYLSGDGDLIREVNGSDSIVIASNISEFDLSLEGGSDYLVIATILSSVDSGGVDIIEEATGYAVLRSLFGGLGTVYKTIITGAGDMGITGSGVTIEGDVRAHGDIKITSSGSFITGDAEASGSINDPNDGILGDKHEYADLPPSPEPLEIPGDIDYFFGGGGNINLDNYDEVWVDPAHTQLKSGVYYAPNGTIRLIKNGVTCEEDGVTLIGRKVTIQSQNSQLTPYYAGILLWGTGTAQKTVGLSGCGGAAWEGVIYAPSGEIHISTGLAIRGGVVAKELDLSAAGGELLIML